MELQTKFKKMGIPKILNPVLENWCFKFACSPGCSKCRGSDPGCNNPPIKKERQDFLNWVHGTKMKNHNTKRNLIALDFMWRVGNMRFRQYGMHMGIMWKPEVALMNTTLRQSRIKKFQAYFSKIPDTLESHVTNLSGLTLSRDQAKLICDWVEDEFQVQLPMGVRKKMLMTSIALIFLINRLVPKGDKRMMFMMFHAVFKISLVRIHNKRRHSRHINDENFLNVIFPE